MAGSMNTFIVNAIEAGARIPASFRPVIETMIRTGKLSEAAAKAILGIKDDGTPALNDVAAAAERFGFKLDEVGGKVPQLQITQQADQMAKDFDTLINGAGMSMDALIDKTKDQVQSLVTRALGAGLVLPEALRPWLQKFVDAGVLLDATGNKLTDLSGITFQVPLLDKIDALIGKIGDFIDSLSRMGDEGVRQFGRIRGAAAEVTGAATSRPGSTTAQTVVPSGASIAAGAGSRPMVITMNMDGRTVARASLPYLSDEVELNTA
jgi:hypothetical protein